MPSNRTYKYMRHKLLELQGEIDEATVTVGDFNTPPSEMDRLKNKDMVELCNTIWIWLTSKDYLIPQKQNTHSFQADMEHSLKLTVLWAIKHNKFKILEIIKYMFSHHNGLKLDINNRKISGKSKNYLVIKQHTFK